MPAGNRRSHVTIGGRPEREQPFSESLIIDTDVGGVVHLGTVADVRRGRPTLQRWSLRRQVVMRSVVICLDCALGVAGTPRGRRQYVGRDYWLQR